MPGRKRKPTALKFVTGNPGKRPLNPDEPLPKGTVRKPSFVKDDAERIWKKYAPALEQLGVLTSVDVDMFGLWCSLMAEYQENPKHFLVSKIAQLRALASEFGLTPSSRPKLRVPKAEPSPAEKFFD